MKKWLLVIIITVIFTSNVARADVSLFVMEAIGVAGEYTGSGHTAIYLSNICADGAVRLRLCQKGEPGIVISNYPSFGNGLSYEWMAIPLIPFLYGVGNEKDIPLYANGDVRNFLRETYRRNHLRTVIPDTRDGTLPKGGWRTMLTTAFNRDVYSFTIQTTAEEDKRFLQEFNSVPNKGNFNIFTRNCADFARRAINKYFPGAARRDWINDFGITTPKAVARSFARYAKNRPERLFYVTRYPQVAGPIWRSFDNRNFTEMAFKSKKYLIPALVFEPSLVAIFSSVYLLTGRFDIHKTYIEYPTPEIARLKLERQRLNDPRFMYFTGSTRREEIETNIERQRSALLGDRETWNAHKASFAPILEKAIAQGIFQDVKEVNTFFRDLELQSEPAFDSNGRLILKVRYYGHDRELGITRQNILDANSDRELALKLILAKINADLNASEKNRSLYQDFWADWRIMRQIIRDQASVLAGIDKKRGRFLKDPSPTSVKHKLEKLVIAITH